jgi:hypothetical protein
MNASSALSIQTSSWPASEGASRVWPRLKVGHHLVAFDAAAHAFALELGVQRGEVDDEQVGGAAI